MFIHKELRNSDLSNKGTWCRLLGYTDDFDNVEKSGYMLIREDNGQIIYSDSVKFHDNEEMTPIEGLEKVFDLSIVSHLTYAESEETEQIGREIVGID